MKYPIIGFSGKARTGKDTAADMLLAEAGGYRYAFADPIRGMLKALGLDMTERRWQEAKEEPIEVFGGKSPRYLMQTLGTEWGRNMVCDTLWLNLAEFVLKNNGPGMIISDLRFENEADWVRRQGGLVVHITRPGAVAVRSHASEAGIAAHKDDLHVVNDGTKADLREQLLHLF